MGKKSVTFTRYSFKGNTHTHKYAESNFIDLTHKWKKIIYVCNLEKTILNCTNEKEK